MILFCKSFLVGFKVSVNGAMKVLVESDMTDELLMRQFLKFNGIEAEGEARVHRKAYGGRSAEAINNKPILNYLKKVRKEEKKLWI